MKNRGLTLLEVILALAILAGAMAAIGEVMRSGMRNAAAARDLSKAQLLCESKLSEIAAGVLPPESVNDEPIETDSDWVYSVTAAPLEQEGLLAVSVTVTQAIESQHPMSFGLIRWMRDPSLAAASTTTDSSSTNSSSNNSSSSTNSTSSSGTSGGGAGN